MMCTSCTGKVESALGAVEGVVSVRTDLKKGTATVEMDRDVADEVLTMAVIDAGFKAKIKQGLFG